jgi:predicted protein tyrosine phosphatase
MTNSKMPETRRAEIIQNPYQGPFKRVLCVCSGGILRSPTAAWVLSNEPYSFNTRAAGTKPFALIQIHADLLAWADQIVCMEESHRQAIYQRASDLHSTQNYPHRSIPVPILVLDIPDIYNYREPALIARIRRSYEKEASK